MKKEKKINLYTVLSYLCLILGFFICVFALAAIIGIAIIYKRADLITILRMVIGFVLIGAFFAFRFLAHKNNAQNNPPIE